MTTPTAVNKPNNVMCIESLVVDGEKVLSLGKVYETSKVYSYLFDKSYVAIINDVDCYHHIKSLEDDELDDFCSKFFIEVE